MRSEYRFEGVQDDGNSQRRDVINTMVLSKELAKNEVQGPAKAKAQAQTASFHEHMNFERDRH